MTEMPSLPELTALGWAWVAAALILLAGVPLGLWMRLRRRHAGLRRALQHATAQLKAGRTRDPLTGLVSRGEFEIALEEAAHAADHAPHKPLSVFYIGFDDFRSVNDGFGLQAGDTVLQQAGARLSRLVGDRPWVSRVAGDEFALLAPVEPKAAGALAGQIAASLAQPFELPGQSLRLGLSIGVACYPEHGAWSRLVAHAALAMRQVRQGGGNGHALYDPTMAADPRDQVVLLQDLRAALERQQLQLVYQPKVDARTLQVTAAEALLRWVHPLRGVISPAQFVPLAERHGLIGAIGNWVISEACRQAAAWREGGLRMRIAVNLSAHQLRNEGLVAFIETELARHGIAPSRLTCEITESVAMEDTEHTRAAFERLRRAGLHVSIDDFGTGHSSLAVLRGVPAAELKIDRAFVADLAVSESARSIVEAVLRVARTLDLRVVAEGVETDAQRDILVAMGCDEMQGYLFAKPMSAAALALWADGDTALSRPPAFRASLFQATQPPPLVR